MEKTKGWVVHMTVHNMSNFLAYGKPDASAWLVIVLGDAISVLIAVYSPVCVAPN